MHEELKQQQSSDGSDASIKSEFDRISQENNMLHQ